MKGHKKLWKTGIFLLVIFLLGMGAGMVLSHKGISDTKNSVLAHTTTVQELRTDKIAVVNLDTGIAVGDENINYAGRLLVNLPDNFLLTGLEDARQGLNHGLYAGYLVVPATFSQNIVSLNETPVRAEISYMINDDLTAEYKEKAIYSVLEFVSNLNDNVSYMYLNSLMDEFHDAQNESEMIMKNDQGEREAIDAIQAKDLISLIPVTEVTEVEYDIQPVDITEYMTKNAELTGQVGTKYMEYLQASEVDHQKLIVQSTALMEEMQNMDGIIMGVNLALDAEGNSVYQTGEEKLSTLFEEHNQKLMEKKQALDEGVLQIYTDVQNYLSEYERSINAYQEENQEKYLDTLTALENLFHEYQSSYVLVPTEQYVQMKDALAAATFSAENGKYQLCTIDGKSMYEVPPQEVGATVMNRAFANKDIKINYIAGYLKENLQIEDLQVAAILGNMYAESKFSPLISQEDDEDLYQPEYIKRNIKSIEKDGIGWGLIQWTHWSRKRALYDYAVSKGDVSYFGDMDTQLEYLVYELKDGMCKQPFSKFIEIQDVDQAAIYFRENIEVAEANHDDTRKIAAENILKDILESER